MLRVAQDDTLAYQELLLKFEPRLRRVLKQVVNSESLAEDLVQDVFLRVWRARARYKPAAKFSTWLFHIAHNVASNAIRDGKRRKEYQAATNDQGSSANLGLEHMALASTGAMPVRKLDRAERADMVRFAIESLNERQRMALMLCKFEGLSYQEIADTMELSVQAVKSLLSRARVNLKTLLQPYLDTGSLPGGARQVDSEEASGEDS
ncbi:MAG: sigma-70 family RNA polymerase sigma factor [Aureliella sp.]